MTLWKKNLLSKDLCDKERPAHEGQYIEEDDATEKESMRKVEAVNKDNKEDLVKIGMTPPWFVFGQTQRHRETSQVPQPLLYITVGEPE